MLLDVERGTLKKVAETGGGRKGRPEGGAGGGRVVRRRKVLRPMAEDFQEGMTRRGRQYGGRLMALVTADLAVSFRTCHSLTLPDCLQTFLITIGQLIARTVDRPG